MTSTESVSRILREARRLITDERHWTRCTLARDADGADVPPGCSVATRWCAQGAVYKAGESASNQDVYAAIDLLHEWARRDGCKAIYTLNDRARNAHQRVLRAFDRAIAEVSP